MSFYKDLNEVKMDLHDLEEAPLTKKEHKRILKRATASIGSGQHRKHWLGIGVAAAVLVISLPLASTGVLANIPIIGDFVKTFYSSTEEHNFSAYKTAIGETAENEAGKVTLHEVLMDHRELFLSATFEPADGFDYRNPGIPSVTINGKDYTNAASMQTIERNADMFATIAVLGFNQDIIADPLNINISYNRDGPGEVEQPWTFDITVSQDNLVAEKTVIDINKTVPLESGGEVNIQKVVATPISTNVYFDLSDEATESLWIAVQLEDGTEKRVSTARTSNTTGDISNARFHGVPVDEGNLKLIFYDHNRDVIGSTTLVESGVQSDG
ncbi:DUF4179 domain-containing protein [Aureibacillus halotolerans]|uniref:Uncharacterized protein DUF4179 n=1 Tax=Aureibacillus halotolerans TaxID=1508390 RepID=A0A4R6U5J3_9BACI|nr:DUF4179 domain-containing protein [Aureibacillus halotolerans]TDQ38304.1 uncharacterized protein DUF4179 [Aureibacillus halotolerans]